VDRWQREENGKGVQRWEKWGKVELGIAVSKMMGREEEG